MTRPNLLFVFSDQHRWCDLGCYGNSDVFSPNIDAFAEQSLRFERCISNSPLCVPARGGLLTGQFPLRHGAVSNDLPIRHDVRSVGHVLSDEGYRTGYIGKWHLAGVPRDRIVPAGEGRLGFDTWKVNNCSHAYSDTCYCDEENEKHPVVGYEPEFQTDLAIEFLESQREEPWALTLSWGPPHEPYLEVPDQYLDIYRERELRLRENLKTPVLIDSRRQWSDAEVMECLRGYYAHITALDGQFKRLLDVLEATGQAENTIVVYTSDHGDMLGSQGFGNKQLPYEEAVRVPLIVRWPGKVRAGVSSEMLGLVDLPVSLMGLMGMSFDNETDGLDLRELFLREDAKGLTECYLFDYIAAHQASDRGGESWRALRTERYTFALDAHGRDWLLFDNLKDPYQLNNLAEHPGYVELRSQLGKTLRGYIEENDCLLTGEEFVRHFGLTEEWNRSQEYFGLPLIK